MVRPRIDRDTTMATRRFLARNGRENAWPADAERSGRSDRNKAPDWDAEQDRERTASRAGGLAAADTDAPASQDISWRKKNKPSDRVSLVGPARQAGPTNETRSLYGTNCRQISSVISRT